jgi:tetratricopeptide (TPR) repeat protein
MAALDEIIKDNLELDEGLDAHIKNIEAFYKITGDLARTYYYLAMSHYYQTKDTLALTYLVKTLELRPHEPDALYFAGEISAKHEAYQEAIQYFETLTELKPDDLAAWFYLGVCCTQTQEFERAIDIYEQRVLHLDPHHVDAMTNLAYLYNEVGNHEKSMEDIRMIDELQE